MFGSIFWGKESGVLVVVTAKTVCAPFTASLMVAGSSKSSFATSTPFFARACPPEPDGSRVKPRILYSFESSASLRT